MDTGLVIHFAIGIIVVTIALTLGWLRTGRLLLAAAVTAALISGLYVIHTAVVAKLPLPGMLPIHMVAAMAGTGAYIAARRVPARATVFSIAGLVLFAVAAVIGRQLFLTHGL